MNYFTYLDIQNSHIEQHLKGEEAINDPMNYVKKIKCKFND